MKKIGNFHQPMKIQHASIAHLFISDPSGINDISEARANEKISWIAKLFMTHPPIQERINALLAHTKTETKIDA